MTRVIALTALAALGFPVTRSTTRSTPGEATGWTGPRLDDLAGTDHCAHIALRRVAIAADGKLFAAWMPA